MLALLTRFCAGWFQHKQIGDNIFLVQRDRDNWLVRMGERRVNVYVPVRSFLGRKVGFCGVIQETWNSPFETLRIMPDEKQQVESALKHYLANKGIQYVVTD